LRINGCADFDERNADGAVKRRIDLGIFQVGLDGGYIVLCCLDLLFGSFQIGQLMIQGLLGYSLLFGLF
jgi:hypothetical protein